MGEDASEELEVAELWCGEEWEVRDSDSRRSEGSSGCGALASGQRVKRSEASSGGGGFGFKATCVALVEIGCRGRNISGYLAW